jgi:hypothetical protein
VVIAVSSLLDLLRPDVELDQGVQHAADVDGYSRYGFESMLEQG